MKIGVYLGENYAQVGVLTDGSQPQTHYLDDNNGGGVPILFMHSQETGGDYCGYECEQKSEAIDHPEEVVRSIYRRILEGGSLSAVVSSNGKNTAAEVLKKYLAYLLSMFKKNADKSGEISDHAFETVCVTIPVCFSAKMLAELTTYIQKTISDICAIPEQSVFVIEAPVAATAYYVKENRTADRDHTALVFDFDDGTYASIVEYKSSVGSLTIKEKQGDSCLGVRDWDRALANYFRSKADYRELLSVEEEYELLRVAQAAREDLCMRNDAVIIYDDAMEKITLNEFDNATRGLLDMAIGLARSAVDNYEIKGHSVDEIILVGEGCAMQQIKPAMRAAFPHLGMDNVLMDDRSQALVKGATIFTELSVCSEGGTRNKNS